MLYFCVCLNKGTCHGRVVAYSTANIWPGFDPYCRPSQKQVSFFTSLLSSSVPSIKHQIVQKWDVKRSIHPLYINNLLYWTFLNILDVPQYIVYLVNTSKRSKFKMFSVISSMEDFSRQCQTVGTWVIGQWEYFINVLDMFYHNERFHILLPNYNCTMLRDQQLNYWNSPQIRKIVKLK